MTIEQFEHHICVLRPVLLSIGLSYFGVEDDAEDAVQEAMLRLWMVRDRLQPPYQPIAIRIARNCYTDMLRRRKLGTLAMDGTLVERTEPSDTGNPHTQMVEQENAEWLWHRMENMPEAQRRIFQAFYEDGLSADEIARIVGIKVHSVRTVLAAARKQLIAALKMRNDK